MKIMANVLTAGAHTMMTTNRHLTEQGRTSPLAGHRHCSGEFLLCATACLDLLLHRNADLFLLTGSGPLS
jgi:hypothetical protein